MFFTQVIDRVENLFVCLTLHYNILTTLTKTIKNLIHKRHKSFNINYLIVIIHIIKVHYKQSFLY